MVEYDIGVLRFDNQIEIDGEGSLPFSRGGDSGSLIVDHELRGVGLLFAGGGDHGGSNGMGLTFANPLHAVTASAQGLADSQVREEVLIGTRRSDRLKRVADVASEDRKHEPDHTGGGPRRQAAST